MKTAIWKNLRENHIVDNKILKNLHKKCGLRSLHKIFHKFGPCSCICSVTIYTYFGDAAAIIFNSREYPVLPTLTYSDTYLFKIRCNILTSLKYGAIGHKNFRKKLVSVTQH